MHFLLHSYCHTDISSNHFANLIVIHITYSLHIPIGNLNYDDLMELLNLAELSKRRKVCDILLLFKIIKGHLDSSDLVNMIKYRVPNKYNTRFQAPFYEVVARFNYMSNSCSQRLHRVWNETSSVDIFSIDNIITFKKQTYIHL